MTAEQLYSFASGKITLDDPAQYTAYLTDLLDATNFEHRELAIRCLGQIGPSAASAIPQLVEKLDADEFWIRKRATRSLVQIGQTSVDALQESLLVESGRKRAATVMALGQLVELRETQIQQLAGDIEPRVRVAVADYLSRQQASAVPTLVKLLADPETVVAAQAAIALATNRTAPELAVPELAKALEREILEDEVAIALANYGVDAQAAIPDLLKIACEKNYGGFAPLKGSNVLEALDHIGPGRIEDIEKIASLLSAESHKGTIQVARNLKRIGLNALPIADQLEQVIFELVDHGDDVGRMFEGAIGPVSDADDSGATHDAAVYCASVMWVITQDAEKSNRMFHTVAKRTGRQVTFSRVEDWDGFAWSSKESVVALFSNGNKALPFEAWRVLGNLDNESQEYLDVVKEMTRDERSDIREAAIQLIAKKQESLKSETKDKLTDQEIEYQIKVLEGEDGRARGTAQSLLESNGSRSIAAVPKLLQLANDQNRSPFERLHTAAAITRISGNVEPLYSLIDELLDRPEFTDYHRRQIFWTIEKMGAAGVPFQEYVFQELRETNPNETYRFVSILESLGSEQAIDRITELLSSKSWKTQRMARAALTRINRLQANETKEQK